MSTATDHPVVGPYLRTTILTSARAIDVVLPTTQPVSSLLPALLDLVGPEAGGSSHRLYLLDGRPLRQDLTLAEAGLRDGAQLRLTGAAEAPPDPIVYDLVDAVEEERPRGVWDAASRDWALPLVIGGLLAAAAVVSGSPTLRSTGSGLALVGVVALAASLVAAWRSRTAIAWGSFTVAWVMLPLGTMLNASTRDLVWVGFAVPILLLNLGACARQMPAASAGVMVWLGVLVAGGATWGLTGEVGLAAAVVVVLCGMFLGLAPRIALATTGAFSVDEQLGRGAQLRRSRVASTVTAAHLSLLGAVAVIALSGAAAMAVAVSERPDDGWTLALVGSAAVAWLVRVRHVPLVAERLLLGAGALVGLAAVARVAAERWPAAETALVLGLLAAAAVCTLVLLREPTPLMAATVRRWAGRLETVAVLLGIPLLVGAFGVYSAMLDTF